MKNYLPILFFCLFPFLLVLSFEGLSPFTYAIGFLTIGALISIHFQARKGATVNNNYNNEDDTI